MGLDQYFFKKRKGVDEADGVGYFRKCNMLRKWMVDRVQYPEDGNCVDFLVSKETLEQLVADCETVLAAKNQKNAESVASRVMPTQGGFFFGNTEYNEYYYNDVELIRDTVSEIIKGTDFDNEDICYHEWW